MRSIAADSGLPPTKREKIKDTSFGILSKSKSKRVVKIIKM